MLLSLILRMLRRNVGELAASGCVVIASNSKPSNLLDCSPPDTFHDIIQICEIRGALLCLPFLPSHSYMA